VQSVKLIDNMRELRAKFVSWVAKVEATSTEQGVQYMQGVGGFTVHSEVAGTAEGLCK
jgi:hypothetical protein